MKTQLLQCALALTTSVFAAGAAMAQDADALATDLTESYVAAFNAGSASEVAALYADDAIILAPNLDRAEGRAAIEAALDGQFQQMGARNLDVTVDETMQQGDAIIGSGTYTMTINGPAGEMPVTGDWLSISVQDAGGGYLITRHIWNIDLPPMGQ